MRSSSAFTLIELLIVIAVIFIIAALAIPPILRKRDAQKAPATPPAPAWKKDMVHADNQMATYVVTSPDGQQWVVFNGQGTTALPYTSIAPTVEKK